METTCIMRLMGVMGFVWPRVVGGVRCRFDGDGYMCSSHDMIPAVS